MAESQREQSKDYTKCFLRALFLTNNTQKTDVITLHQENPNNTGGDEGGADGFHGGDFLLQADGADDERKDDAHVAGGRDKRRILGDGESVENDHVVGLGDETDGEDTHVA